MTTLSGAAQSAKSPEAFRTISEVATELDIPQHVLRFWETRFSQVKPVKRAGGRRYYRPQDVDLLRGIRDLLYSDGLTIKGVQKVLRERGSREVADVGRGKTIFAVKETSANTKVWTDEATHARAIMAELARVHTVIEPDTSHVPTEISSAAPEAISGDAEPLQVLMSDLAGLKNRLRAAISRSAKRA